MKCRCMLLLLLLSMEAGAEIRWTGLSSNGLWADPGNWENGILPGVNDDVLLDNSFVLTSYSVLFPDFAVTVGSLQVLPANIQSITVELPVTNVLSSPSGSLLDRAFTTTGNGYTLLLGNGAVFINASGSNSGYSMRLNDSMQVKNGARYIHRTRTGHADIVQVLGKSPGTEKGIFRFENPDAASTISLSGRVYGSLQLSATANILGTVSYSASGTNPVTIRGDLVLETGAGLAINFDDTISISGNLVMNNAVFNMATGNRSSVLVLEGNWLQSGGSVTETNTQQKTGTIALKGSSRQTISCTGVLIDSIIVDVINTAGVQLQQPLRCPFGLRLTNGTLLTSGLQLVSLAPGAWIQADSTARQAFVDGPIKKEGLDHEYFLFPVGRNNQLRWMALRNASGDMQVEYHPESAYTIGTSLGAGLDHLSQVEYWSVTSSGMNTVQAELSYDHTLSGGVSELVSLRAAAFTLGSWADAGNLATSGAAFSNGSVTSGPIQDLGTTVQSLTLASSSSFTNVLPLLITDQWMDYKMGSWTVNWKVDQDEAVTRYEIELSADGKTFIKSGGYLADHKQQYFRQLIPAVWQKGFLRINAIHKNGTGEFGEVLRFGMAFRPQDKLGIWHMAGNSTIQVESEQSRQVVIELFDASGRCITRKPIQLISGIATVSLANRYLPAGIYWIRIYENNQLLVTRALFF